MFNAALATIFPVGLYVFHTFVAWNNELQSAKFAYLIFVISYFYGVLVAMLVIKKPKAAVVISGETVLNLPAWPFSILIVGKIIAVVGLLLIAEEYVAGYGYGGLRAYLVSEDIKNATYYSSVLMRINAYFLYPLMLALVPVAWVAQKKYFWILILLGLIEYAVIYSGRMFFYHVAVVMVLKILFNRGQTPQAVKQFLPFAFVLLLAAMALVAIRDDPHGGEIIERSINSVKGSIINYHLISPFILDSLVNESTYFTRHTGLGWATFGFIIDPMVLLAAPEARDLMPSKVLSREAQEVVVHFHDQAYNAFASFLYLAMFDFGMVGPLLYGVASGFLVTTAYKRANCWGGIVYMIFGAFVFFNAFTFSITGEWLLALVVGGWVQQRCRSKDVLCDRPNGEVGGANFDVKLK